MEEKKQVKFIMTTVIGGVIFLVPAVFLMMVILKAVDLMKKIAKPLANWLPVETIGGVALADIIAIAALLLICFIAGLVARQASAGKLLNQLETRLLEKAPGYKRIRSVVKGFDTTRVGGLKPVILKIGSARQAGFEVQRLEDGRSVVFLPESPSAFTGITQVIPAEELAYLDVPLKRIIECSQNYGHGLAELVRMSEQQGDPRS